MTALVLPVVLLLMMLALQQVEQLLERSTGNRDPRPPAPDAVDLA